MVGVAYVDAAARQLGVAQLDDDEQLCALEAIVVQLGAKEAVVCKVRGPVGRLGTWVLAGGAVGRPCAQQWSFRACCLVQRGGRGVV